MTAFVTTKTPRPGLVAIELAIGELYVLRQQHTPAAILPRLIAKGTVDLSLWDRTEAY